MTITVYLIVCERGGEKERGRKRGKRRGGRRERGKRRERERRERERRENLGQGVSSTTFYKYWCMYACTNVLLCKIFQILKRYPFPWFLH